MEIFEEALRYRYRARMHEVCHGSILLVKTKHVLATNIGQNLVGLKLGREIFLVDKENKTDDSTSFPQNKSTFKYSDILTREKMTKY